jgi:hypothetical protein
MRSISTTSRLRAVAAVATLGSALLIGAALAPAASASVTTHNKADVGLFGAADPSFDGAFRQSLGLLAEQAAGVRDQAAITWLVNQQCPDGGWTAYRSDLSKSCPATDLMAFTGEDSNSTALAVQALHALGVTPKYDAIAFLHLLQDSDGGFPLLKGSGTDPNSTGVVVQAIKVVGQDPTSAAWTVSGKTAMDGLMSFWLDCSSAFASPYSSGHADMVATVQAVWGAAQMPFPFATTATTAQPAPSCSGGSVPPPADAAADAATWLAGQLQGGGYLTTGSSPDYSLTSQGVLAMAATATNSAGIDKAITYLAANVHSAVVDSKGVVSPGALGYLALAVHATGRSETNFGGADLIAMLRASQRALPSTPASTPSTTPAGSSTGTSTGTPATAPTASPATLATTGRNTELQLALALTLVAVGCALNAAGRPHRRVRR